MFKLRLTFRQWADALDAGTLGEQREYVKSLGEFLMPELYASMRRTNESLLSYGWERIPE